MLFEFTLNQCQDSQSENQWNNNEWVANIIYHRNQKNNHHKSDKNNMQSEKFIQHHQLFDEEKIDTSEN